LGGSCSELAKNVAAFIASEPLSFGAPVSLEGSLCEVLGSWIDNARTAARKEPSVCSQDVHCEGVISAHGNLTPIFCGQDITAAYLHLADCGTREAEKEDLLTRLHGMEHCLSF
jgi:hypothetical protein